MSAVVVVGSANVDLQADVEHLPAPGETMLGGTLRVSPGGKGANQAIAARRLGADVRFICAVGEDIYASTVLNALHQAGIDTRDVRCVAGASTGLALITVAHDGENTIVVVPGANAELAPEDLATLGDSAMGPGTVMLLQLEVPIPTALAAARQAHRTGATVVLNCAPMARDRHVIGALLAEVDVLVVNETEARALGADHIDDAQGWTGAATELRSAGAHTVVVTLGSDGAVAADGTGTIRQPAFPVDPVDTTGAGDVFSAALAVGLSAGLPLPVLLRRACAAGALATLVRGAQAGAPTAEGVDRMIELDEAVV